MICLLLTGCGKKTTEVKPDEFIQEDEVVESYTKMTLNGKDYNYNYSVSSILLLGIDAYLGDPLLGQSDFMSLIVFNKDDKKVSLLTIPRDTMTLVSEYRDGEELCAYVTHITLAYPLGGDSPSACARNSIAATSMMLNDVPIDNYISIPLTSLEDLVDVFGEMDIELEDDSLAFRNPDYVKGYMFHVDKNTIETYVRARDINVDNSALDRSKRQQIYLKRCMASMVDILNGNSSTSIARLLMLLESCNSNLTNAQIEKYMDYFKEYQTNGVDFKTIPGSPNNSSEYDEYIIDRSALDQMIVELFYK